MDKDDLLRRTKEFALRTMKLVDALPRSRSANAVASQLVRSGTSVVSNYRAPVGLARERNLSPRSVSLRKKLTKAPSGWSS